MSDPIPFEVIAKNLGSVRARIAESARKVSRAPESVRLIAVTKYAGVAEIQALRSLGVSSFGESRVQDVEKKSLALRTHLSADEMSPAAGFWHLIGHLQTNKADKAVSLFGTIHSVDSLRVAQALHKELLKRPAATMTPQVMNCLLEINIASESSKSGLPPDRAVLEELLKHSTDFQSVRIRGLMCMAPHSDDSETSRPVFRALREMQDQLNAARVYPYALSELSMGMTQDYFIAVEEGATMVRVGSALFQR